MRIFTIAFIVCFFVFLAASAQSNFKPGYIVNLKGDTLRGEIDYREWETTPTEVRFKQQNTGSVTEVTPQNSKGFAINGLEHYISATTWFSKNPLNVAQLSTVVDTVRIKGTAFLKVLAAGQNVTLYSFTDNIKQRLFFSEGLKETPEELIFQLYKLNNTIQKVSTFIRQLQRLAATYQPDNNKLLLAIQSSRYDAVEIAKIIYIINGTSAPKISFAAKGGSLNFFVGGGLQLSKYSFNTKLASNELFNNATFSPTISAGIDLLANRNIGKLIFRMELALSANKFSLDYSEYNNTLSKYYLSANLNTFSVIPQVIYNFYNSNNLKIYGAGGIGFTFNQYSKKVHRYENYVGGVLIRSDDLNFPREQNFALRLNTRAGIVIDRRFDIYVGYLPATNIIDLPNNSIKTSNYRFGVNYIFTHN